MKTHIPNPKTGKTLCGRDSHQAFTDSWDHDGGETCQRCSDSQERRRVEHQMNEVRRAIRQEALDKSKSNVV
jgi:hypothetical protein